MTDPRIQRARARASWPIRRLDLGSEGSGDDLRGTTTASERLKMMWPLAEEAWSLTGQPWPTYTRAQAPGKIIRRWA